MREFFRRLFMPFLTGPACTIDEECTQPAFPQSDNQCNCETLLGGINELYFIPCTETFSEENVTSIPWWQNLLDDDPGPRLLGRSGLILGSIAKLSDTRERVGSCRTEQITSITWGLTAQIKCFDKSSARSTCAKLNELVNNFSRYLVVARMCDGDDVILPIGKFDTNDIDWTVPDNNDELQVAQIVLAWKEKGFPCTIDVAGLSAVLPKLQ